MAGSDIPELDWFMDFCVQELQTNYVIRGIPGQTMDSSWSSWAGGGYFYGFWAGEILRGLSLYALASTGKRI